MAAALVLSGCSFEEQSAADQPNACLLDTDCVSGSSCEGGICVMSTGDEPLSFTLEVTPRRMPDGSQPFPIQIGPFMLQESKREFELPVPSQTHGAVRQGILPVPAQLTFVPTKISASIAKPITARATEGLARFSVQLLTGVEYRVLVQPTDSTIRPFTRTFVAGDRGGELDLDYADVERTLRSFVIKNLPSPSPALSVKARAKSSGQIISNTTQLVGGRAELELSQDVAYRLEIAPEPSLVRVSFTFDDSCSAPESSVPTFTIEDTALTWEDADRNSLLFELPDLPATVTYSGTVQLCTRDKPRDPLPMTLTSSALQLADTAAANVPAISYSFNTMARPNNDGGFDFCTRTLPGEYVVVVTPPSSIDCEIFSEKRLIVEAEDDGAGDTLELRTPAKLSGTIQDTAMTPIANATIEAVALRTQSGLTLAENDPTVPLYNRSRQTSSDANGAFSLSVDVGAYDLVVKPPSQSGFAWQIQSGVNVAARKDIFSTMVKLGPPMLIQGALRYSSNRSSDQRTLAGAEVHIYTVVDGDSPEARGVEIGRSEADDDGNINLLVSPQGEGPW